MSLWIKRNAIRILLIVFTLILLSLVPAGNQALLTFRGAADLAVLDMAQAAPLNQENLSVFSPTAVVDCGDTTCPSQDSGFSSLDKCVERTNFCVYYTTDSITETEAEFAADQVQDYWNRFVALSFNPPKHTGKLQVYLEDIPSDCNGGTGWSIDYMTTYAGCWALGDDVAQRVLGHELTHRVQYAYDTSTSAPIQTKFLKEGTARATEDNWFTNIDHQAAAGSNYCAEAAGYLGNTNSDLSNLWYKACVWWKFASEQYGSTMTEPERGIDFVRAVYDQNTSGKSRIAAVNGALTIKAPGTSFNDSFKQFAVTAYTKDLSGLPDDSYNIIDEDEVGSPGTCGSVTPADKGSIQTGTSRQWTNQNISKYGMRYYKADVGTNCPVISASFHRDSGPLFYHIVTQDGNTFKTHVQGSGTDWTQSFINDGNITRVVAIAGSLDGGSQVDVTLECADPDIDIKMPNSGAVAHVQDSTKFLAQVLVTNGSPTGPVVAGLTNNDFSARVGGVNAAVTGGGFIQEQYWLLVRAPSGLADGTYDLEIMLEEPGTSTVVANDTNLGAIEYTSDKVDHVLVIDRSGSMGTPIEPTDAKLEAAKDAANFYVDVSRTGDGLSVVPYDHDVTPSLVFDMASVTAAVRTDAKDNYIDPLSPGGATSIGDGLYEASLQEGSSPTGNPLCSFVLLSDGMENSERKWDTGLNPVKPDVLATGCPVTTIAFGPESNETLMQTIAQDTGGLSFYNDVYVSATSNVNAIIPLPPYTEGDMALDLTSTYEYAQGLSEGRQRLLAEKGIITSRQVHSYTVLVDDSISEVLFALDWHAYGTVLGLALVKPDGTVIDPADPTTPYDFANLSSGYVGWRIPNPDDGTWKMVVSMLYAGETKLVPYQVLASGKTTLTLDLLLPDRLGTAFTTGKYLPLYAFLSNAGPVPGVPISATITAPSCPLQGPRKTVLPLFDDGQHGDGAAGDGFYANLYTRVTCADAAQPPDEGVPEPPDAADEGGYGVELIAGNSNFQRIAMGAFAILEDDDTDGDGMPDSWEDANGLDKNDPNDADLDPDLDLLTNSEEYLAGTDPHNSDTDGGGENDGSEVDYAQDPLDPSDDQIEAPDFFHADPENNKVLLTYDVKTEYGKMELWRAPSPEGPWNLRVNELPLDGYYEDAATNDSTYFYKLIAEESIVMLSGANEVAVAGHRSAVLDSESVTPSVDPFPPQAHVIINGGEPSTEDRDVILTFVPYELEMGDPDTFGDIDEMIISNDPSFADAEWQTFDQDVPWTLVGTPNSVNVVYARFRDANDNETVGTEAGSILYETNMLYLPLIQD